MSQHRTPLRYPGGKQRLAPFIRETIELNGLIGGQYVEPYAGGAGVAWELLLGNYVSHVHLNDSSIPVYAFWKSVLFKTEDLCRRITSVSLTVKEWKRHREIVKSPSGIDEVEVGFSMLYLNRCNRSGVLSGGLIGGLNQTGQWKMDARFPRNELIRRIEAIASRKDAVTVTNRDAEMYIKDNVTHLPDNTLVYCDPPYYDKSSRLYLDKYHKDDHARIARVIQGQLPKRWIVSYDNCPDLVQLYKGRKSFTYDLQYSASRSYLGKEIFIFSDDLNIPPSSKLPFINKSLEIQTLMCPI